MCKAARQLWHDYFRNPSPEALENIIDMCSRNLVFIGPDRQTFYKSAADAFHRVHENAQKENKISPLGPCDITDEWYECLCISSDIYVVYGNLHIKEKTGTKHPALRDTDSRFSVIYHVTSNSYEILHIHHSIPCV